MFTILYQKLKKFAYLLQPKYIVSALVLASIIIGFKQYFIGSYNNYSIFKNTFWHLINQQSLYDHYPSQYWDKNHYGPLFAVFFAPFALLPDAIGMVLWNVCSTLLFCLAIYQLPLPQKKASLLLLLCSNELITALLSFQSNVVLVAGLLFCFSFIIRDKNIKATFFIVSFFLIKLYGIVGLAFFFFTKKKMAFIGYTLLWLLVLFVVPMVFSSPEFILQTYNQWFATLVDKNSQNVALNSCQDFSVMGIVRRVLANPNIPNLPFIISGLFLFGLPYIRISQYKFLEYRLLLLASTLIFTVIFSSGSESPTYIIAFTGVGIWFISKTNPTQTQIALLVFAILLTSLSVTDIFPKIARLFIKNYALKALPCVIIWLVIIFEMLTKNFEPKTPSTVCQN